MTRATMAARRAELYADVEEYVASTLRQRGIAAESAEAAAAAAADMLAAEWRGQQITFPMNGQREGRACRDADIAARMGSESVADLAREYGMTERGIRKAAHRAHARQISATQSKGVP